MCGVNILSLSRIFIVVCDNPRDNDKQLGNNVIATLNVSWSPSIILSMMSILIEAVVFPVGIVKLNT